MKRRALTAAVCSDARTPRALCERAEERLAVAYVEKPSASRRVHFNQTRVAAYDWKCISENLTNCKPTSYNLGMLGLTPGMQVLGVHNDSEADRRGLFRGMKLRAFNGDYIQSPEEFSFLLSEFEIYNSTIDLELEFLSVDESERLYPYPIEQFADQTPSDAVYAFCLKSELLQPNYTAAGVQTQFLNQLCANSNNKNGCDRYSPKFLVFELPLDYAGTRHTLRFYAEDWPPCPGEYRPAFTSPYETSRPCTPAAYRAARHFCQELSGLEAPANCEQDLAVMIAQQLEKHEEKRWDEKSTPDGVDLYAAIGVNRDASTSDINNSYVELAAQLAHSYSKLETIMSYAQKILTELEEIRALARVLIRRTNFSIHDAIVHLESDIVHFAPDYLISNIFSKKNVSLSNAEALVGTTSVQVLLKTGYLTFLNSNDESAEVSPEPRNQRRRGGTTSINKASPRNSHERLLFSTKLKEFRHWFELADAVANARTLDTAAQAAEFVSQTGQSRLDLAHKLLATANSLAIEANVTLSELEEPLAELSKKAFALNYAHETLTDETNRDFYDRPCRPVFGACCVRDAPDGGMRITCGS
uniref:PDZ domain-containing protein n=1 Tax=Aureoumbra lagunensis TaxID=44058 RepID=A0A7S3NLM0_9STRA